MHGETIKLRSRYSQTLSTWHRLQPKFNPNPFHVGCMVDRVALNRVLLTKHFTATQSLLSLQLFLHIR